MLKGTQVVLSLFIVGVGLLLTAYLLMSSSVAINENVVEGTERMRLLPAGLPEGTHFRFYSIGYFNRSLAGMEEEGISTMRDPCALQPAEEIIVVRILFNTSKLPDSCDLFADDVLQSEIDLRPSHCATCRERELIISTNTKMQDLSAPHVLRLCCTGICIAAEVAPLCSS